MSIKYYKRDIMEFLDDKKQECINIVTIKYHKLRYDKEVEILKEKGYFDKCNVISSGLADIKEKIDKLALDMRDDKSLNYKAGSVYSLERYLQSFENEDESIKRIINCCEFTDKKLMQLNKKFKQELNDITTNYSSIIAVCNRMSNQKMAEYLIGLGFDLSSIGIETEKALEIPLDLSKVFIYKEKQSA